MLLIKYVALNGVVSIKKNMMILLCCKKGRKNGYKRGIEEIFCTGTETV
jgi:hypothetical protein